MYADISECSHTSHNTGTIKAQNLKPQTPIPKAYTVLNLDPKSKSRTLCLSQAAP